jgi:hypothetical protein
MAKHRYRATGGPSPFGCLLLLAVLAAWLGCAQCFAQASSSSSISGSAASQTSVISRDPLAVQMLQTVIQILGGAGWGGVLKAHAEFNTTYPALQGYSGTQTWDDDWSGGFLVYTHTLVDSNGTHVLSGSAGHQVTSQEASGTTSLPAAVQVISWPFYLPAAVLQTALSNPALSIKYVGSVGTSANVVRIEISNSAIAHYRDPYSKQDWDIDLSTGYPTQVRFYTLDIANHQPWPQTIAFSAYQSYGGLLVPAILYCNATLNGAVTLQLTSLSLNQN